LRKLENKLRRNYKYFFWLFTVNMITLSRVLISIYYFVKNTFNFYDIVVISIFFSSDFLDGYLARKLNVTSNFGKVWDQWADKIVFLIFYLILLKNENGYYLIFLLFLIRDFFINYLRTIDRYKGILITSMLNKYKTFLQYILILGSIYNSIININYLGDFLLIFSILILFLAYYPFYQILKHEFREINR